MGTEYLLFGGRDESGKARTMVPIETTGLKRGQVVSYGNQAVSRHTAVVIEEQGRTSAGQRCIYTDTFLPSDVSVTLIDGPGGWRLEDEVWTEDRVKELERQSLETIQARRDAVKEREQKRVETIDRGTELAKTIVPAWARAYIVAENEEDDCDVMTDYFNTKTVGSMILGFSRHTRDLFPELRAAAGKFEHTKHLADAGPDVEHREKYSMGAGYYLKASGRYSTGWRVKKWVISKYSNDDLALLLGRGNYLPELEHPAAPATHGAGVTINEERNGVEVRFEDKPSEEVRIRLKAAGFRWSRHQGLWYARRSEKTEAAAREICGA